MPVSSDSNTTSGRERLIEATLNCLADRGNHSTTVRSIALAAGVTPGLVRHHFKSKNALMVAAYESFNLEIDERLATVNWDTDTNIQTTVADAIRSYFPEDLTDTGKMRIMVAFWEQILTNPEIARIQKKSYDRIQKFFTALVEYYGTERKQARNIAIGIISVADGLWLECCLNPGRMKPKAAVEIAINFSLASCLNKE